MIGWPHSYGPVVRQHIMTSCSCHGGLPGSKQEEKERDQHLSFSNNPHLINDESSEVKSLAHCPLGHSYDLSYNQHGSRN